jgi:hypothetical protein
MNNNNQLADDADDLSSTTGSDFEPVNVQQQEQEPLNDENEWLTTGDGLLRNVVGNNGNLCNNFTG